MLLVELSGQEASRFQRNLCLPDRWRTQLRRFSARVFLRLGPFFQRVLSQFRKVKNRLAWTYVPPRALRLTFPFGVSSSKIMALKFWILVPGNNPCVGG